MSIRRYLWKEWKRACVQRYPALKRMPLDDAYLRWQTYRAEERRKLGVWYYTPWFCAAIIVGMIFIADHLPKEFILIAHFSVPAATWWVQRRIGKRIDAKIIAELGDGRLWHCYECGYDLRESQETCPECGAAVRVEPPRPS